MANIILAKYQHVSYVVVSSSILMFDAKVQPLRAASVFEKT